jgi:hypothetical protein
MKKPHIAIIPSLFLSVLLSAPPAWTATTTLVANLSQANEVPPTGSPGTGIATVVLDTVAQTLAVDIAFSGLISTTTAAHIHCCLASPFQSGVNAPVATAVPTFPGFPLGVTSGTYSMTFDLMQGGTYNPAFITAHGGTVAGAEAALISALLAGETYLNIHTANFPNGEIRGFLAAVPEPSTWGMMLLGFAGLGYAFRQSRRKPSLA